MRSNHISIPTGKIVFKNAQAESAQVKPVHFYERLYTWLMTLCDKIFLDIYFSLNILTFLDQN